MHALWQMLFLFLASCLLAVTNGYDRFHLANYRAHIQIPDATVAAFEGKFAEHCWSHDIDVDQ